MELIRVPVPVLVIWFLLSGMRLSSSYSPPFFDYAVAPGKCGGYCKGGRQLTYLIFICIYVVTTNSLAFPTSLKLFCDIKKHSPCFGYFEKEFESCT